jgi:hypothetical protein
MHFTFIDYPSQYENEIETWCDESAIRFALDGDNVKTEHQSYLDADKYTQGENYFCKIILDGDMPVALFMLVILKDEIKTYLTENIVYLDTLIINPMLRYQGYGAKIITDVLLHSDRIIGSSHCVFISQIHKDNVHAKRLAAKIGFYLICEEIEKDDDWFDWIYPPSAADRYCAFRDKTSD